MITYGLLILRPIYFEAVQLPHLSALDTCLALVPFGIGTILGTVIFAALYRTSRAGAAAPRTQAPGGRASQPKTEPIQVGS
jgi:hypothetical protein